VIGLGQGLQKELGQVDSKDSPCETPKGGSEAVFDRVNACPPVFVAEG